MSNPTTPFSWQMPTATDLVTDLPADFEVFGQAVATSMADLLGGASGYILSKNSATDMDFVWIANDQGDITGITAGTGISVTSPTGPVPTVAIDTTVTVDKTSVQTLTNKTLTSPALTTPTISTATTNGDILYGTGSGALQRLGIGSTAQVLTVASGIPSWATPAGGGGKVLQVVQGSYSTSTANATTTFADTGLSLSITPTSATSKVLVFVNQYTLNSRLNTDQGHALKIFRGATEIFATGTSSGAGYIYVSGATDVELGVRVPLTYLDSPATTSATTYKTQGRPVYSTNSGQVIFQHGSSPSVITLMEIGA
jgi:hypothetical protein